MAEKSERLRAFADAVLSFKLDWSAALPDQPAIPVDGKALSVRQVCDLVAAFDDRLPDDVCDHLLAEMHFGSDDLRLKLVGNPTYATAATCLRELIERKLAAYQQRNS
jgi:hypothetical protein